MRFQIVLIVLFLGFGLLAYGQPTGDIEQDTVKANALFQEALAFDLFDNSNSGKIQVLVEEAMTLYEPYPFTIRKLEIRSYVAYQKTISSKTTDEGYKLAIENIELGEKELNNKYHPCLINTYGALLFYNVKYSENRQGIIKACEESLKIVPKYSFFYFEALYNLTKQKIFTRDDIETIKKLIDQYDTELKLTKYDNDDRLIHHKGRLHELKAGYFRLRRNFEKAIVHNEINYTLLLDENDFKNAAIIAVEYLFNDFFMLGQEHQAEIWLEKAVNIIEGNQKEQIFFSDFEEADFWTILSYNYSLLYKKEKTIAYAQKAIDLYGEKYNRRLSIIYFNLSLFCQSLDDFEEAIEYVKLSTKYEPNYFIQSEQHGILSFQTKKYDEALEYLQKGLVKISQYFDSYDIYQNPPTNENALDKIEKSTILLWKSRAFYEKAIALPTINTKLLEEALKVGKLAYETAQIELMSLRGYQTSIMSVRSNLAVRLDNLLIIYYQLYQQTQNKEYLEAIFQRMEEKKSLVLLSSLSTNSLPENLLKQEAELSKIVNHFQLQKDLSTQSDSTKYYMKRLLEATEERDHFIEKLREDYPQQMNNFYAPQYIKPQEIQQQLDNETILIEYNVAIRGDELITIHIYMVTKELKKIYQVTCDNTSLTKQLNEFRRLLQDPFIAQEKNKNRFIELSHQLYELLLTPLETNLEGKTKLLIIPETYLSYIPFEVLLPKNDKKTFEELDFLIKKYDVSYNYSATIQTKLKKKLAITDNSFLGFAPVFEKDKGSTGLTRSISFLVDSLYRSIDKDRFNPLLHTKKEIQTIEGLLKEKGQTSVLLGNKATKANFNQKVKEQSFQFMHFATHGLVNYQNPRLSALACFNKTEDKASTLLFANEIQFQNIKADLVVLSSCESGIGQLKVGEGLIALNRSFIYAGARNVLFSLWKVSDKESSTLMIDFYKEYLKKPSYTGALRQAKLNMISNPKTALPTYWAPFILIGE